MRETSLAASMKCIPIPVLYCAPQTWPSEDPSQRDEEGADSRLGRGRLRRGYVPILLRIVRSPLPQRFPSCLDGSNVRAQKKSIFFSAGTQGVTFEKVDHSCFFRWVKIDVPVEFD